MEVCIKKLTCSQTKSLSSGGVDYFGFQLEEMSGNVSPPLDQMTESVDFSISLGLSLVASASNWSDIFFT